MQRQVLSSEKGGKVVQVDDEEEMLAKIIKDYKQSIFKSPFHPHSIPLFSSIRFQVVLILSLITTFE